MTAKRRPGLIAVSIFVCSLMPLRTLAQSGVQYVYDDLGRLVGVIDPSGNAAGYQYDAVGNLLAITRYTASQAEVLNFSPTSGPVGSTVTITGTGFSTTISQDTVSFNGTIATVTSATVNQIVATVPMGATTGPISVASPAGAFTTASSFKVTAANGAPTITGFTPAIGVAGTTVSVSGTNFDSSTLSNDVLALNVTRAMPTAATSTSITTSVPTITASGHFSVRTPAGKAVSANYFFVPPPPYSVSSVQYTGQMAIGGQTNVGISTASKIGLLVFDGSQGQNVTLQASAGTFGTCNLTISILTPTGSTLSSNNCMGSSGSLGTGALPSTGTYTVLLVPSGTATGSITINLYNAPDITGTIVPSGSPVTVTTTVPGQRVRLTFSGTKGQIVSAEVAGFGTGSFTLSILNDGITLASVSGTSMLSLTGKTLASAGTYTLLITPDSSVSGTATASLVSQTTNNSIAFNTPVTQSSSVTSMIGLNFSGTAGQIVSAEGAGLSGGYFTMTILNPDGSMFASAYNGSNTVSLIGKTLASTGTYQILIIPNNGVTGSATLSLTSQTTNDTISFNTPVTKTISTPSAIGLSFSGTAGQVVSTEVAGLGGGIFATFLLNPDGSTLASSTGTNQLSLIGKTLASTGTYSILILPNNGVTGSATASLTSQTTNDTISFNTPVTKTITATSAIGLSFSGTAGQIVSVEAAGLNGYFWTYLLKPDGTTLASTFTSSQGSIVGKTLASTGTYTILIFPNNGVTGSVTVSLTSQTTNDTISFSTPVTKSISVASAVGLSFSGTGGQTATVQVTPSFGGGFFWTYLLNPDGSTLTSTFSSSSVTFSRKTLATTGTYQILILPNNGVTGSVTVSLTSP